MSSSDGDKKGKRRACTECHKCKSKCVYPSQNDDDTDNRCERCFRLNKECIPHKSRQGKRKTLEYNPDHPNYNNSSEHSSPYPQQQHNLGQHHHHQVEVTSSSQFTGPMAAALAMSNNSNMNISNHQSQYLDMIEGLTWFERQAMFDNS